MVLRIPGSNFARPSHGCPVAPGGFRHEPRPGVTSPLSATEGHDEVAKGMTRLRGSESKTFMLVPFLSRFGGT